VTTCGGTVASAKIVELDVAADQQCEDERDRLRHQLPRGERQRPRGRAIEPLGVADHAHSGRAPAASDSGPSTARPTRKRL
jgi:hypothetical protein